MFNEILFKPYVPPAFNIQKVPPPPPPELVDDELEYEVESILDSRLHRRQLQYLVKWVGYQEATWQPESDLTHAHQAISDFYKAHPSALKQLDLLNETYKDAYTLIRQK